MISFRCFDFDLQGHDDINSEDVFKLAANTLIYDITSKNEKR